MPWVKVVKYEEYVSQYIYSYEVSQLVEPPFSLAKSIVT